VRKLACGAIQDEVMLREGAAQLDAYAVEQKAKAKNLRHGELLWFKQRKSA